jgi:hypothetical protein
MIQIHSIDVLDKDGKQTLFHQSFENLYVANEKLYQNWEDNIHRKYSSMIDVGIKLNIYRVQRPPNNVNPKEIAEKATQKMQVKYSDIFGKARTRGVTECRMFITNICLDLGFTPAEIERHLWKNRIYAHYRRVLNERRETEPKTKSYYEEVKEFVLESLYTK